MSAPTVESKGPGPFAAAKPAPGRNGRILGLALEVQEARLSCDMDRLNQTSDEEFEEFFQVLSRIRDLFTAGGECLRRSAERRNAAILQADSAAAPNAALGATAAVVPVAVPGTDGAPAFRIAEGAGAAIPAEATAAGAATEQRAGVPSGASAPAVAPKEKSRRRRQRGGRGHRRAHATASPPTQERSSSAIRNTDAPPAGTEKKNGGRPKAQAAGAGAPLTEAAGRGEPTEAGDELVAALEASRCHQSPGRFLGRELHPSPLHRLRIFWRSGFVLMLHGYADGGMTVTALDWKNDGRGYTGAASPQFATFDGYAAMLASLSSGVVPAAAAGRGAKASLWVVLDTGARPAKSLWALPLGPLDSTASLVAAAQYHEFVLSLSRTQGCGRWHYGRA